MAKRLKSNDSHTTHSLTLNQIIKNRKNDSDQQLLLFSQNLYKFQISKSNNQEGN